MSKHKLFKRPEAWLLIILFLYFGLIYICNLTTVSLWADEGIEYFYSKYMNGPIPVNATNLVWRTTSNMYERICQTYQPPLYNILMHFWLLLFDSESGFRMAGVVVTFIGAIGFYLALRHVSNYKWGMVGICIYLSTSVIFFYALECGEYNLLLCMECWTLYYFVICSNCPQGKVSWKNLILFFLFASLSINSQYGAALFVISLFVTLCYIFIKRREMTSLKRLFVVGTTTFILTIVPLIFFFLRIQLTSQGTVVVNHSPVFVGSFLGGIPYSFFKSIYEQIIYIFSTSLSWGWHSFHFMLATIASIFILFFLSLYSKSKLQVHTPVIIASSVSYGLFFFLSAFSFYAYNSWDGQLGCNNIIHQTRYVLFFVPLLLYTITTSIISVYKSITNHHIKKFMSVYVILLLTVFSVNLTWSLKNSRIKSFDREAIKAWLDRKDYDSNIVIHEFTASTFLFYVQQSSLYSGSKKDAIIITNHDINTTEKIESFLYKMRLTDSSSFYLIVNNDAPGIEKGEKIQLICDLLTNKGYKVDCIFNRKTILLYISKLQCSKKLIRNEGSPNISIF